MVGKDRSDRENIMDRMPAISLAAVPGRRSATLDLAVEIEKKGFKAKISLDQGIAELIQIFTNDKNKLINN